MDYTSSNAYATDAGTGNRMHQQSAAVATAVEDKDMNGLIWELVAIIKAGGLAPAAFDATNSATYTQVAQAIQSGKLFSAAAAGTADAITAAFTPAITSLKDGMVLYVRGSLKNTSTTPTFTPNSGTIAAKAIVKGAGTALVAGDIAGAGHWVGLQYDLVQDQWVLLNPATGISAGSGQQAGEVCFFARDTAPSGFMKANGALVSRTTYSTLFAAIGTTFGAGDGSTTFALPDLRGEFLRGFDDGRGVDDARTFGSFQQGTHITGDNGDTASVQGIAILNQANVDPPDGAGRTVNFTLTGVGTVSISTHWGRVRPRNLALLACIKF